MKKKYDHGQVSQLHLLQAEARWQNLVPDTARARRDYELLLNNLKNLAGIPVEDDIRLKGDLQDLPALPGMKDMKMILEQRPDYNALLWEEKLMTTGIKAEKANKLPSLDLNMSYNFSALSDQFKLERQNKSYVIGLNLSIPIYSGGYQHAQVQKAKIEREKTRIKIDQERDDIFNEVHNIYLRLQEAHQRIAAAKATLETAKKAFEIAEITAANGLATQLELKDSRVVYDQARLKVYAAAYDYLDAYFDWQQAAGNEK
jgi:outer membrane protein